MQQQKKSQIIIISIVILLVVYGINQIFQSNKQKDRIKLDKDFSSKEIKIVGLYDPSEYGLTMDMCSNSDVIRLKNGNQKKRNKLIDYLSENK